MNEPSDKHGIIVGFFILLGIAILIAGILIIGNLHETFKQKMRVAVLFEDVNGLQAGNNVWFSGVKIGTVNNLEFYGKSQVKVVFKIETKVQAYIRKDAKVKISTDGLIGNKILVIYGGTPAAGQVQEDDTLGTEKTFSSEEMMNTLQENNNNLKSITGDFKIISKKLVNGEGTIGKLLKDTSVYTNIDAATASLKQASAKAEQLIASLSTFSSGLNKKGTLANQLVTDTVVFNSMKASVLKLHSIADTASLFISDLKHAGSNPKSSMGLLLHDEESGAHLKATIKNLESSSQKLDEDLAAVQHNFLLRGYFKKQAKKQAKKNEK
jgi:phospholipid/cholesterol/gamma-HCH transport system substrate-binding protein